MDLGKLSLILKTFSPVDGLKYGENVYRVAEGVYILSDKASFSVEELIHYINEESVHHDKKPLKNEDIQKIFDKIVEAGLSKEATGESLRSNKCFKSDNISRAILSDFFTIDWVPRNGKSGFGSFLFQCHLRTVEWCCIYLAGKTFSVEEISALSGLKHTVCVNSLHELSKSDRAENGQLDYVLGKYRLKNGSGIPTEEEKMLEELSRGYQDHQNHRPTKKDYIIEILKEHESLSGAELHRHLIKLGINCTDKAVYHHLGILKHANKIEDDPKKVNDGRTQKVRLVEENEKLAKTVLLKNIRKAFNQAEINVEEEFFNKAKKTTVANLRVFYRQLNDVVLAKDKHEYSSYQLWTDLFSQMDPTKGFAENVSKFVSSKSNLEAEIKRTTEEYNISPALLLLLHFSKIDR